MEPQTPNNNPPQDKEATQKKEWITPEMQPMELMSGVGMGSDDAMRS
jgi:hypothetical protein